MKRIQFFTIITLLALSLAGCTDTSGFKDEPDVAPTPHGVANIQLDISLLDLAANTETRAGETYEAAATPQELINMLRIIIVDGEGFVEHNRLIDLKEGPKSEYISGIFKVKSNDKKQVYIFANELPMTDEWKNNGYYPFGTLLPGLKFDEASPGETQSPKEAIENLIVKANPETHILFDNRGKEDKDKLNIPINEHFEFEVKEADYENENGLGTIHNPYIYNCFITRAATKFTFNATYEGAEGFKEPIAIKEIRISKIGNQEYLLPKATEYIPAKYEDLTSSDEGRYISKYGVPENGTVNSIYTFPVNFEFTTAGQKNTYSPEIYFPETELSAPNTAYQIQIVTGEGEYTLESTWETMTNLPSLSRNTHVIVNLNLTPRDISCEVKVVPYVEIKLDPIFGDFDGKSPIISWPVHNF